ncbi:LamG-like jellyroll fold domain-containing protein [Methanococcoides methylutens]|uniref:LamG-like jellyroll fold domain-containing protein n=1 Tax=Methanococcoides methylutens TaxID=2226 RepID=UPI004044E525
MNSKAKSLMHVLFISLLALALSVSVASTEESVTLYDGNALEFKTPPDVVAYANTLYSEPPNEFKIATSGAVWQYKHWISLTKQGEWIEAKTGIETTTVGVQFWGDSNGGWARVLVDGEKVWSGDTYGGDSKFPEGKFIKYLEISGLDKGFHTIRVENMGNSGQGGGDDVNIYFFGLMKPSTVKPTPTPTPSPTPVSEKELVAYYPFDGNVKDYSGNDNHGFNDGATFVSGVRDQSLSFDGKGDYVRSPVNINPDNMPQTTMVAWAKADEVRGTIISHDDGSYDRTISIDDRGDGVGWSAFSGSGGILGPHPVTAGEWIFLAAVYDQDAETVTLYVNDKVYEEKGKMGNGRDYTIIGSNPESGVHFSGDIDEVRIYNYALSQSEIDSMRKEVTVPAPETTPTPEPIADGFNGLMFESRSKANGSIVQIPLTLNGVRDNIGNMVMTLRYDSSVLVATEVVKGSLTNDSLLDYNIVDGTIKINVDDKDGFSGDGSVFYVRFKVVGTEGSSTALDITSLSANRIDKTSLNIATKEGVFKVIGMEESKGDAFGDGGELTALDALYALQMAVRMIPEDLAMDMDGDGSVTSNDARLILKSSVKLD